MEFIFYLIFRITLSGDIHPNPGPRNHCCKALYINIRGLKANLQDVAVASSKYDIIFCSETLVSSFRHVSELLIPSFKRHLLRRDSILRAQGMCVYLRPTCSASRITKFECGCHEMMLIKICSRFNNYYIFSVYRNPVLDDSIYDCLLSSISSSIQDSEPKPSFVFVGDFNAHHQEWLNSISPTNQHGRAALDFSNLSGCEQIVQSQTHVSGNCLDLLTDAPSAVTVQVVPPIGSTDHSGLSFNIQTSFSIPDEPITRKVFLKSRANWADVIADFNNIVWREVFLG